jgi:hypothetical protein
VITEFGATEGQRDYLFDLRRDYEAARTEWARLAGVKIKPIAWRPMPADFDAMSQALTEGKTAVTTVRAQRNAARLLRPGAALSPYRRPRGTRPGALPVSERSDHGGAAQRCAGRQSRSAFRRSRRTTFRRAPLRRAL